LSHTLHMYLYFFIGILYKYKSWCCYIIDDNYNHSSLDAQYKMVNAGFSSLLFYGQYKIIMEEHGRNKCRKLGASTDTNSMNIKLISYKTIPSLSDNEDDDDDATYIRNSGLKISVEYIPEIDDDEMKTILSKGLESVVELIKYLHFNNTRPETQNMYISNLRDSVVKYFDTDRWRIEGIEKFIPELYDNMSSLLQLKLEKLYDNLDHTTIIEMEKFLETQDDKWVKKKLFREIVLLLYNNRNMPINTYKRLYPKEK